MKPELRRVTPDQMSFTQASIGKWAERIFGVPESEEEKISAVTRIIDEVEELDHELRLLEMMISTTAYTNEQKWEVLNKVRLELADVIITAMSTMYPLGISVVDDVLAKQEVNENRKWLRNPDKPGTGRHVKTDKDLMLWNEQMGNKER